MSPTLLRESSANKKKKKKQDNKKSPFYQISQKNSSIYCSPFGVVKVKSRE